MIDITGAGPNGLELYDTQTPRAANILSVQLRSLEYEPTLGIDLDYFLTENVRFQNESFNAYLVQRLAEFGLNVASLVETVNELYNDLVINLTPEENTTALVAR